jgi:hypothetical protein
MSSRVATKQPVLIVDTEEYTPPDLFRAPFRALMDFWRKNKVGALSCVPSSHRPAGWWSSMAEQLDGCTAAQSFQPPDCPGNNR